MCRFILIYILFFALHTQARIPSLSQEAREFFASDILTGQIISMYSSLETRSNIKNINYTAILKINKNQKGDYTSDQIIFSCWKAIDSADRPDGPMGQENKIFEINDTVRVYLYKSKDNLYKLLDPNGFDKL